MEILDLQAAVGGQVGRIVRRALATSTPVRAKWVQTTSTCLTANGKALASVKFACMSSIAFDQSKAAMRTKRSGCSIGSGEAKLAALQSTRIRGRAGDQGVLQAGHLFVPSVS